MSAPEIGLRVMPSVNWSVGCDKSSLKEFEILTPLFHLSKAVLSRTNLSTDTRLLSCSGAAIGYMRPEYP
jgi:hypothetical protein